MKKIILGICCLLIGLGAAFTGCRPHEEAELLPDTSGLISFRVPAGWPQPAYDFQGHNPLTQPGFELGRKLFYEVRLSRDNTVSCGSCHQQFAAFSHLDHPVSHGIDGLLGTRNGPGLFNMAWKTAYFWDGGVINLENQPLAPIENHVEMDLPIATLVDKLNGIEEYKTQFKSVFGQAPITSQQLFFALTQFVGALVSSNSRYDKYSRGETGGNLSAAEQRGLSLFRDKCAACHREPLFTDYSFRNNGLAPDPAFNDSGRAHVTGDPGDRYRFMVPSLRNVELTRPYMHDGRFNTLDGALDHYRSGVQSSVTLDPLLQSGIALTDEEKADVIAFLKTLTDTTFTHDKRFAEPR